MMFWKAPNNAHEALSLPLRLARLSTDLLFFLSGAVGIILPEVVSRVGLSDSFVWWPVPAIVALIWSLVLYPKEFPGQLTKPGLIRPITLAWGFAGGAITWISQVRGERVTSYKWILFSFCFSLLLYLVSTRRLRRFLF